MSKFNEAVNVLLLGQPFFGTLLLKMKHVADEKFPTAYVSRCELHYNPAFFESLTLDEAVFVVGHEVMHLAWGHLPRLEHFMQSGIGPDGQKFDWELYAQALDYPNNHSLVVAGVGTPMPKEKFPLCLDPQRYPHTMTPEEVYCDLKKRQEQNGGKPLPGLGKPLDHHEALADAEATDAITPADILQAAMQHKAIKGEFPAGIERLIEAIKKPALSPWKRLRNFITTHLPGFDTTTWRKLQRRLIVRGVGVPGRVTKGAGRVGCVVDTSGSIGAEMLQLFGGHMAAIMSDAMPREVVVFWVDAHVHRVDVVKTPSDLRRLLTKPVPGGGGTDMRKGVRAAETEGCDSIVVLTDGCTPFCASKKPLLWAITEQSITAPHGETIHI